MPGVVGVGSASPSLLPAVSLQAQQAQTVQAQQQAAQAQAQHAAQLLSAAGLTQPAVGVAGVVPGSLSIAAPNTNANTTAAVATPSPTATLAGVDTSGLTTSQLAQLQHQQMQVGLSWVLQRTLLAMTRQTQKKGGVAIRR